MGATIVDGAVLARRIRARAAADVAAMERPPGLATVLVGDDPASAVYVRNKRRLCVEAGMLDQHRHLPGDAGEADVAAVIDELAKGDAVTGILPQLPLPAHPHATSLIARIPPDKDVDGLTETNAGRLALGRPGLRPCTPAVLVVAAGRPGLIGANAIKPGATVIDVGIHRGPQGLRGDVDFDGVRAVAGAVTPCPAASGR